MSNCLFVGRFVSSTSSYKSSIICLEILQKTIKLFFSVPLFLENDELFDFNFCTDAIDFAEDVT